MEVQVKSFFVAKKNFLAKKKLKSRQALHDTFFNPQYIDP